MVCHSFKWCPKVYDRAGIAPPLDLPNFNPFGRLFGIIFQDSDGHSRTRTISPYEYCHCWGLDPNLIVSLSEGVHNLQLLDAALPANTSHAIIEAVLSKLTDLKFRHTEFLDSRDAAAPAATALSFLQGATTLKLPSPATWRDAYKNDPETSLLIEMIQKPQLIGIPILGGGSGGMDGEGVIIGRGSLRGV